MIRQEANDLIQEIQEAQADIQSIEYTMQYISDKDGEEFLECQSIYNFLKDTLQYLEEDLFLEHNLTVFELDKIMLGNKISKDIEI